MSAAPLRVIAIGLRGVPYVQGGIETHAAELYPRLARLGAEVLVLGRQRFRPAEVGTSWDGIQLRWLWAPRRRGFEAAVHTFLGVLYAAVRRPDVLHIHAVGPSLAAPLAKLLGLRVVVTHHGQDYLREKWTGPERAMIRLGERLAMRFSDEVIAISSHLCGMLHARYGRAATWIPNGVGSLKTSASNELMKKYGLTRGHYVIQVGRLVPEKRQLDLVAAFRAAQLPGWKLVLVGGSQGEDDYASELARATAGDAAIVCTGALEPTAAHGLLADAGMFVLPSSHEGLPIALLEAVAHGVPSLASDIPGNREIGLDDENYFAVGDTTALALRLRELVTSSTARAAAVKRYPDICSRFDWNEIALATIAVMQQASGASRSRPPAKQAAAATLGVSTRAAADLKAAP